MTEKHLQWNSSFLIGIEKLDYEHKGLLKDINRLHKELSGHVEKGEIENCLGEIYTRMQAHFALEEHYMKDHKYVFFDEHKQEHEKLLDSYTEFMVQFLNNSGLPSGAKVENNLKHWILDHIMTSDKKMSLMVQQSES